MKYSVFLLRSFTLLLVLASVWGYQAAAVQRSDEKAQVRSERKLFRSKSSVKQKHQRHFSENTLMALTKEKPRASAVRYV